MGLFKRKPKADEVDVPLVRGDGETSFTVPAGVTEWAYKRVMKMLGWDRPKLGGQTDRFDVVLRSSPGDRFIVKYHGYPLGFVSDETGTRLVRKALTHAGVGVIRARAYIWKSRQDGTLGLRIYLPA